jgi:RNA polymerase sigma factor (sigma-70 family)
MPQWPATRVTLLERLRDPRDQEAWSEFVDLYGPLIFAFAQRRLPQHEDAADVTQEVLGALLKGTYQRPGGRFQKWLVTVVLNKIRDFHAAKYRHVEKLGGTSVPEHLLEEPNPSEEAEWDRDREQRLFRAAADRVRARVSPVQWDVFVRTALENRPSKEVAAALNVSLTNVYVIKSRVMKEIKDEVFRMGEG